MSDHQTSPAPYAILTLESLTLKRFTNQDDWKAAIDTVQARGQDYVPLKYHAGSRRYFIPERYE